MSLRTRLAIVAAGAVALAVVVASVAVYFIVRSELFSPIDRGLRDTATAVHVPRFIAGLTPGPHPHEFVIQAGPFGDRLPVPYRMVTNTGTTLVPQFYEQVLGSLPVSTQAKLVAAANGSPYYFDVRAGGQDLRSYTVNVGTDLAVQIFTAITTENHALSRIKLWLILIAVAGVALASAAGFFIARAALRPVRRLSETAERVRTTRDLTQRISVSGSDEVAQLAATFNAMLASLDAAAERQRQLVQDASHELRTPLTSLRTNIEVLASGKELPPDERRHLLGDVVAQLGEMTALIGELTQLAQGEKEEQHVEDVRLDLIADDVIRRTERNHPHVRIHADLAESSAVGTPASLERAFANLLDNAAKWSPPGGPVEVRLRGGELTVRDHGPGIDESDLPHVFERFYRATSARSMPGSGLGLAIVRQVAEAHGGTLMRFKIRNGAGPDNGNS